MDVSGKRVLLERYIVLETLEQVLFPAFQEPLMRMASWYFPTTEQNMTKMAPQNILIWKKRQ